MTAGPAALSVVVVAWNAADRLPRMLAGLRDQALPELELVVVDNASTDGSAGLVESLWPGALVERAPVNLGFAAAASRGVEMSHGRAVALLNYDVVLGPGYLARCWAELHARPGLGSVQGLLLRPGGVTVDSAGHQVSRGRWFRNRGENQPAGARAWAPASVFGVSGAAAVYRREMLDDVRQVTGHLFDPAFFAYLEDVDLDYRARWRGWESAVVGDAVAIHERSGSGARRTAAVQRHIVKNRLLVLYRNEDRGNLLRDLPWVAGQVAARLGLAAVTAPRSLAGVGDFLALLPDQRSTRRAIRDARRVKPAEVRAWFTRPAEGAGLATRTGLPAGPRAVAEGPGLLVVCGEPLGERLAGPGIRAVELAGALSAAGIAVTVAAPPGDGDPPLDAAVRRVALDRRTLQRELANAGAVLVGASLLARFPQLAKAAVPLAVDLYVPVPLEAAELFRASPAGLLRATVAEAEETLRFELARADLVLCAGERQRALYAGYAQKLGRGDIESLFRVLPFGVPDTPPPPRSGALRSRLPGVAADDPVVIWAGGLHDWFEPELAVHAVADLRVELPGIRLVFLGADPPNPALQRHRAASRAAAAARERGVLDSSVFFLPGWVPYGERGAYLADADVGISAHRAGPETTYSWRTRLLDYAWAGLPVAATSGDELSARLEAAGAAVLAPPGDRAGLTAALRRLLTDPAEASRAAHASAAVAAELRWSTVARPLVEWAKAPVSTHGQSSRWPATAALWRMYGHKAWHAWREEGVAGVRRRARRFGG